MKRIGGILRYAAAMLAIPVLYLAWVGLNRWTADRKAERPQQAAVPVPAPAGPRGAGVRILQFYASTGELSRGESTIVCYGVENARTVRLEPAGQVLSPSPNRCLSIQPAATTTYRLLAEGFDGRQVSESFTVKVNPAPPRIRFVHLSAASVRRGQPLTICYSVENATSARLEPLGLELQPSRGRCLKTMMVRTTEFTFVAAGAGGRTDREKFTVQVK